MEVYSIWWGYVFLFWTYTFLPIDNIHISYSSVPCCHLEGELWAFCSCDESFRMGGRERGKEMVRPSESGGGEGRRKRVHIVCLCVCLLWCMISIPPLLVQEFLSIANVTYARHKLFPLRGDFGSWDSCNFIAAAASSKIVENRQVLQTCIHFLPCWLLDKQLCSSFLYRG